MKKDDIKQIAKEVIVQAQGYVGMVQNTAKQTEVYKVSSLIIEKIANGYLLKNSGLTPSHQQETYYVERLEDIVPVVKKIFSNK